MKKLKKQHTSIIINPIFFTLFFLFHHSLSIDRNYESCVPKDCGDGKNISYPFHITGLQDPLCGYPGFELRCNINGSATIQISENTFIIKHINYKNRTFRLQNMATQSCDVRKIKNMTLDPTRFTFVTTTKLLISNCSRNLSSKYDKYKIPPCDQKTSTSHEYVMLENDTNNVINVTRDCDKVAMPVEMGGGVVVDGQNYAQVVERGFEMGWLAADCDGCEKSGGRCGFNMTAFRFSCFCTDMPHRVSCKPGKAGGSGPESA